MEGWMAMAQRVERRTSYVPRQHTRELGTSERIGIVLVSLIGLVGLTGTAAIAWVIALS